MRTRHHTPSILRRRWMAAALAGTALAAAGMTRAEDGKPLEWVVGYAAGGGSDIVARAVAEPLARSLMQPIIVNNKPGAATNIAADYVAKAKGEMLLTADFATLAANPSLFARLPYDAAKDFAPVGMLVRFPMLLVVGPGVPARSLADFVAWARAHPEGINYASAGTGSPHHLAAELLREHTGLRLTHVPYRGAAPAIQDLMGGQVPFMMVDTASILPFLGSGKLRALAVASPARLASMPEVPTVAEQGHAGFEVYAWQGLVVPASTPPARIEQLNRALVDALKSDGVQARLKTLALEAMPGTPAEMTAYTTAERERWGRVIRTNHIKLD